MRIIVLAALLLVSLPLAAQDRVDEYVRRQMDKYRIPGLAVGVVKDGRIAKLKGYGTAHIEFAVPATEASAFQTYSVTKIFAGIAIMKLVEDGRLALDTPVTEVMTNVPATWSRIRIRDLLAHTSGLPELNDNPQYAALPEEKRRSVTPEEMVAIAARTPLRAEPGTKFSYHRFAYTLIGAIIEQLSGRPFHIFLEERVFAPLGMRSTLFGDSQAVIARRATAYVRTSGELLTSIYSFGFGNPGAGLNSSAADLAALMKALDADTLLSRRSRDAMWAPASLADGTTLDYALGWTVDRHDGRTVVGHEGGGAAWVAHFPAERLSVVVLCNLNGARADEIPHGIADLFLR